MRKLDAPCNVAIQMWRMYGGSSETTACHAGSERNHAKPDRRDSGRCNEWHQRVEPAHFGHVPHGKARQEV